MNTQVVNVPLSEIVFSEEVNISIPEGFGALDLEGKLAFFEAKRKSGASSTGSPKDSDFTNLCVDVSSRGVTNPIAVNVNDDGDYVLNAGFHRFGALLLSGAETAPCLVVESEYNELAAEDSIRENFVRRKTTISERIEAVHRLKKRGHKQKDIANLLGMPDSSVSRLKKIARIIPEGIIDAADKGPENGGIVESYLFVVVDAERAFDPKYFSDDAKLAKSKWEEFVNEAVTKSRTKAEVKKRVEKVLIERGLKADPNEGKEKDNGPKPKFSLTPSKVEKLIARIDEMHDEAVKEDSYAILTFEELMEPFAALKTEGDALSFTAAQRSMVYYVLCALTGYSNADGEFEPLLAFEALAASDDPQSDMVAVELDCEQFVPKKVEEPEPADGEGEKTDE